MKGSIKTKIHLSILTTSLLSICLFHFMANQTDTYSFVNAIKIIFSESIEADELFRLSKPLALLIPSLLYGILSIPPEYGLFIQQYLFYYLSAIFLYKILLIVFNNEKQAFTGMMSYLFCQPVSVYGLAMLTDGVGWFCTIIGIWLTLKTYTTQTHRTLSLFLLGIYLGSSFFGKESVVVAGIFLFYYILTKEELTVRNKIQNYLCIGSGFILSFASGNYLIYLFSGQTLFDWIKFGRTSPPEFNLIYLIKQAYHTYDVFWIFIIAGVSRYIRGINKNKIFKPLLLTGLTIWLLLPMTWPYYNDRLLFMTAPFMIFFLIEGLSFFSKSALPLVLTAGFMNLLVTFGIYKYQFSNLIITEGVIFIFILTSLLLYIKRTETQNKRNG